MSNLWRLWNLSTAYGRRASEIIGCETEIGAWALDETCLVVGRHIEKAIHEGKDPFDELFTARVKGRASFASAVTAKAKRMKIPDNGVW